MAITFLDDSDKQEIEKEIQNNNDDIGNLKEDLDGLNGELYTDLYNLKSTKGNYTKSEGWKLVGDGTRIADPTSEIIGYIVSDGDLLHLKLNKHTDCVCYFATSYTFKAEAIIGDVIYNSVNKYVKVPSGATRLMISQKLSDTENLVVYARLNSDYDEQRLTDYMGICDSVVKYSKGVNRFNLNDKNNVDGYYIENKMLVEDEKYFVTHLMEIEQNTTYYKNEMGQGIYYDINLNIIGYGSDSSLSFTTPNGCAYYRTSATINIKNKFYVSTKDAVCNFTDKPSLSDDAKTAVEEVVDSVIQEGSIIKTVITSAKSEMLNTTPSSNSACVTFIDDDGRVEGYTRLFPIIKSKNIPYGFAIVPTYDGLENYLTLEQMQEMYAYTNSNEDRLVEFLSHTYNHHGSGINDLTEKEVIIDCASAMEWMNNAGFECHGFVYPHNQTDKNARIGIRRFFDYGFIGVGFNKDGYLDHSKINRIAFGNGMEDNPTIDGISDKTSIEYFKSCVDKAIEDGEWLVFMTHVGSQSTDYDTMLSDLVDYIAEKGISVLSPNDGFNQMRNPVNIGDIDGKYLFVGNDNFASNMIGYQYRLRGELKGNGIATEPITSFIPNAVTITYYNNSANGGYPTSAGVLETFYCKTSPDFSWQKWTAHPTCKQQMRFWDNTNKVWFDWVEIN